MDRGLDMESRGVLPRLPPQFFHAGLSGYDEKLTPHPVLAEALPQLGTDSWKVFPDGRMETTWHDGAPLVADDVALSVQVRIALGTPTNSGGSVLERVIEEVIAPDPRTVVVRWKSHFPFAGESDWLPVPRHILGPSFEQMALETFNNLPYWSTEFVGLGPYRLERWERGAFIKGAAFPGYAHGKPRIGRIQLVWVSDANAAVAQLLSGTVHFATDRAIAFEQATVLRRESAGREPTALLLTAGSARYVQIQYKTEYTNPRALLDVRVRQAFAGAIDKQALVDGLLAGEPAMADTVVSPQTEYFAELDRVLTKYPLDVRRTKQLMAEAGFRKDAEGFYGQGGPRLSAEILAVRDGTGEREALVLADSWKRAGIDTPLRVLTPAQSRDNELESTYSAFATSDIALDDAALGRFAQRSIATAANRWIGPNRGGYLDPEYERLYAIATSSLDRNERNRAVVEAMQLLSEQAAYFPLYYAYEVVAHAASLAGPRTGSRDRAGWKVEEWHWR